MKTTELRGALYQWETFEMSEAADRTLLFASSEHARATLSTVLRARTTGESG